jgi:hypothetical protein
VINASTTGAADPDAKIVSGVYALVVVESVCNDAPITASDSVELIRASRLTERAPYAYAAVASDVRRGRPVAGCG